MPTPPARRRLFALVPCAGTGARAGSAGAQAVRAIAGRPMVAHTLAALARGAAACSRIAGRAGARRSSTSRPRPDLPATAPAVARCGGATRAATVRQRPRELAGARRRRRRLGAGARRRALPGPPELDRRADRRLSRRRGRRPARAAGGRHAQARAEGGRVAATLDRATTTGRRRRRRCSASACCATRWSAAGDDVTDEASAIEARRPAAAAGAGRRRRTSRSPSPSDFALAEALAAQGRDGTRAAIDARSCADRSAHRRRLGHARAGRRAAS